MNPNGISVLVVDDDPLTSSLTGMVLEEEGYEVAFAGDGLEALRLAGANPGLQVVVSDLNMPFLNGIELFRQLRGRVPSPLFVLLTADGVEPLKAEHPDLDGVVAKDEQFQEVLVETLAALLARP